MRNALLLTALLFITIPISFSAITVKPLPYDLREATWLDKILCALGYYKCIDVYVIERGPLYKMEKKNNTIYLYYKSKLVKKTFVTLPKSVIYVKPYEQAGLPAFLMTIQTDTDLTADDIANMFLPDEKNQYWAITPVDYWEPKKYIWKDNWKITIQFALYNDYKDITIDTFRVFYCVINEDGAQSCISTTDDLSDQSSNYRNWKKGTWLVYVYGAGRSEAEYETTSGLMGIYEWLIYDEAKAGKRVYNFFYIGQLEIDTSDGEEIWCNAGEKNDKCDTTQAPTCTVPVPNTNHKAFKAKVQLIMPSGLVDLPVDVCGFGPAEDGFVIEGATCEEKFGKNYATIYDPEYDVDWFFRKEAQNLKACVKCPPHSHGPEYSQDYDEAVCICDKGYYNNDYNTEGTGPSYIEVYLWDPDGCESTAPPPSCDVELSVDKTEDTIQPGESTQFKITVKNVGTTTCTYKLSYNCPSDVSCSLDKASITLSKGSSGTVTLTASSTKEGTYTLTVTAKATQYNGEDSVSMTLKVVKAEIIPQLEVSPTNITLNLSQSTTVNIKIYNKGNKAGTITVSVNCPSGLVCFLYQSSFYLEPGQYKTTTLQIVGKQVGEYNVSVLAKDGYTDVKYIYVKVLNVTGQQQGTGGGGGGGGKVNVTNVTKATPEVEITPKYLEIEKDDIGTVAIYIKNVGKARGSFYINVECPTGLECYLDKTSVEVRPGFFETVYLTIKGTTVGNYTVIITVKDSKTITEKIQVVVIRPSVQSIIDFIMRFVKNYPTFVLLVALFFVAFIIIAAASGRKGKSTD